MNHKDQHHEHHRKEREEHKKEEREHERKQEKSALPFHPAWFVVVGTVLTVIAVLVWTFIL